jgi:ribose transport system ATP-binding protein
MQAVTTEPTLPTAPLSPADEPERSCQDLAKSFGQVTVLENVSFDFYKGTVNILAGENGAGKSTILKIVSGQYHPDKGVVRVGGEIVTNFDPRHARRLGIGIVPQELAPVLDMPVYQNLFLGRELHSRTGLLDHREMIAQSREMLGVFGIDIDPRIWMRRLSVAVMQLVEIVKSTTWGARILLLDEPTSAIPEGEADLLFDVIRKLKERCVVVYTTHRIAEMAAIGDRVVVLRDGRLTYDRAIGEVTEADIVRAMIGRNLTQLFPPKKLTQPTSEPALEVRDLSVEGHPPVSLTIRRGEILGIGGLRGAGRSELLEGIFGVRSSNGEVLVAGRKVGRADPVASIDAGVALVTEDRKRSGLVLTQPVLENTVLTNLERFSGFLGWFRRGQAQDAVGEIVEQTQLKSHGLDQMVETLSGGNQQKVVLAKWLTRDISVMLLDEPTRGVDIGARSEIYRIITDLATRGMAILMVSSELEELLGISHRVLVMRRHTVVGELSMAEVASPTAPERYLRFATGMDVMKLDLEEDLS